MKQNKDVTLIATAAANASDAARSAAEAASKAADNAAIAAKAAADSATAIAVVGTDTSWMKKSLSGIEQTLDEMRNSYITATQHAEVLKELGEHQKLLEKHDTSITQLYAYGTALIFFVGIVEFLIIHFWK